MLTSDNVSMKIHVKLGGLTHRVPLDHLPKCDKHTMLVGVDVTHVCLCLASQLTVASTQAWI